jgi:hypothetical protein
MAPLNGKQVIKAFSTTFYPAMKILLVDLRKDTGCVLTEGRSRLLDIIFERSHPRCGHH